MLVLGLSGDLIGRTDEVRGYVGHDAAAVLVEDGALLVAVEEERLARVKHASYFPVAAAQACLDEVGRSIEDVDRFAFPWMQDGMEAIVAHWRLTDPDRDRPGSAVPFFEDLLAERLGVDAAGKVRFCGHHLAHALSAVTPSGLGDCLVAVFDGSGDDRSGVVYDVRSGQLHERQSFGRHQSLGELYTTLIGAVGFRRFDEYKVMGLAPLGREFAGLVDLSGFVELLDGGDYRLRLDSLKDLAADPGHDLRRHGGPLTDWDKAFAAELQALLTRTVTHVLDHHRGVTGLDDLCLAGGVIHNCALNGELARSGGFGRIFVQPAAHDAGAALGAALAVCGAEGRLGRARPLRSMALGRHIGSDDAVRSQLDRWSGWIEVQTLVGDAAVAEHAAAALGRDEVVGWVQGRAEFGPRALGQRSILADPRPAANRDRLNRLIKQREGFRPFAPSVTAEAFGDWFVPLSSPANTDFMNFVHEVRHDRRSTLGAVTHVDGTARVQTVDRASNELFWLLIDAFGRVDGVPVVLNTSYNGDGEPIVDTVDEAVAGLLTLGLDLLVIGTHVVRPTVARDDPISFLELCPSLPFHRSLRVRPARGPDAVCELATSASPFFGQRPVALSAAAHAVLVRADGRSSIAEALDRAGVDPAQVGVELLDLWRRRIIDLCPPG